VNSTPVRRPRAWGHFWLGHFDLPDVAPTPDARIALIPDRVGARLHEHCNEEMGYLAEFLPGLYARESR